MHFQSFWLVPLFLSRDSHAFSPRNVHRTTTTTTTTRQFTAPHDDSDNDSNNDTLELRKESFERTCKPPNKADLYALEDLQTILNLHNDLQDFRSTYQMPKNAADAPTPSVQDWVQQFLQEEQESPHTPNQMTDETPCTTTTMTPVNPEMQHKLQNIRAIASDVDGTLLNSNHTLHPLTANALVKIVKAVQDPQSHLQYFFLATGKTRSGALHNLTPELQTLLQSFPGVYSQGLYCLGEQQQVVFERLLSAESVQAAEQLALQHQLTLLGYYADRIFATHWSKKQHIDDIHSKYGEPEPVLLPTFQGREWHKLILMHDDNPVLQRVYRPLWNDLAERHGATTTQAVPFMLELLPAGCNKGVGVRQLCQVLGINPETELLALGDGENDKELLEMAACGIAVGNAVAVTKDMADIVMTETNNEGAAGIALEFYGLQQGKSGC